MAGSESGPRTGTTDKPPSLLPFITGLHAEYDCMCQISALSAVANMLSKPALFSV